MARANAKELELIKADLRKLFPRGSTVYTILRHVTPSRMTRRISILAITGRPSDGLLIRHPNWAVSQVLGLKLHTSSMADSVVVSGAGEDKGFRIAHDLGEALYGDGYALSNEWL